MNSRYIPLPQRIPALYGSDSRSECPLGHAQEDLLSTLSHQTGVEFHWKSPPGAAFCKTLNNDVLHIIEAVAFNAGNEADILLNPSFKHQVVSFAEKEIIMDIHSQRGAHAALPFFKLPPVGVVSAPANIPFQRIGFSAAD